MNAEGISESIGVNKFEVDRHVGQSLFVGPGDMGMLVKTSLTSGFRKSPTIRCALGGGAEIFTSKRVIDAFPGNIADEGEACFQDIYSRLEALPVEDAGKMLQIFGIVQPKAEPLPTPDHLEFDRLYFLWTQKFKAMINIVLGGKGRTARFNVFAENGGHVDTHEKLMGMFGAISNKGASEGALASTVVDTLRKLDNRCSGRNRRITDILVALNGQEVRALLDKHRPSLDMKFC